jgi:3-phenylpropionate/trans-cinnamate dioxygenase ferredoxin reductase subunit
MTHAAGTVIVLGTGLAGLRTAETLRTQDYEGRVILVGEAKHLPYEHPALSEELLAGKRSAEQVMLRKPEFFEQEQIKLVPDWRVEQLDAERCLALLDDGRELGWDALVIADALALSEELDRDS